MNTLYKAGDVLYWVGSVFYLLASLRDAGWFASLAGPLLPEQGLRGGDEDEGLGHHPAAATQGTEMARVDEEKAGLLDDAAASAAAAAGRGGDCAPSSPPAPGGADARA